MNDFSGNPFGSWGERDTYRHTHDKFNQDVHVLILWPLHAAMEHLKAEASQEDAKLEPHIVGASAEEHDAIIEQQDLNWQYFPEQERFLQNMALVGLLSHLIHTLRSMARDSEPLATRQGKYKGQGELNQLWTEFTERFELDFSHLHTQISYLDRLRKVRNQIVHDGGDAAVLKPFEMRDITKDGTFDMYDTSFAKDFPEFTCGSDYNAQVVVTEEQIEQGIDYSLQIVKWISEQLYPLEVQWLKLRQSKVN